MFDCEIASRFPIVMDKAANIANIIVHSTLRTSCWNASWKTRRTIANPAALLATDRNAVIGVGNLRIRQGPTCGMAPLLS